ncbi:MAG: c-type cytochrome [Chitinophagales bacterium]|nr:c-type cytochrome [Chitinophagales bacterium]
MSLLAPSEGWFQKKVAKDERMWILIAFAVCIFLFVWMIMWHVVGRQNPSNTTYKTNPTEFAQLHDAYVKKNMIGMDNGIPVVKPEPGSDVILMGQMWRWSPALILKKDEWYNLHISSKDLVHGFSLQPSNMNFQIYPSYDYVLKFKPTAAGECKILCNEYCGIGHHAMIGKIVVIESDADLAKYGYDKLSAAPADYSSSATEEDISGWSNEQLVKAGETVYNLKGCSGCHKTDGTVQIAPSFKGLYGSKSKVSDGKSTFEIQVDDAYIETSVTEPQKHIVVGFEKTQMAKLDLSANELKQVTAFIKSLQ